MKRTPKWYLALAAIFILAFTPSVNAAMKDINAAQFDALLNFDANEDDVADVWVAARFAAPENFKGGADADGDALSNQDEYNMTFFLDEDGDWLSASIIVNSWRVVLNEDIL